jgi:acetoin utilization deacetylase AcuC-like enzyme
MVTGIVYHRKYLEHEQTPAHPERKERLAYTIDKLFKEGILSSEAIRLLEPFEATPEDILAVHTPRYIEFLRRRSIKGGVIDWDTNIPVGLFEIALLAAGGAIRAAKAVAEKEVDNSFAMVRPPGHHAKSYLGAGFCYLNNIAIAVRWLQHRFNRVLILDLDAHHGDGTQEIFYSDESVLFISLHQMPLYPGTGYPHEVGRGEGEGYTINVPLPPGAGDECYMLVLNEIIKPVAREFQPEFIAISAGQDNHFTDPLASLALTARGYAEIMKEAVELSKLCNNRLFAVLEGGYSIKALPYINLGIIAAMAGMDLFIREPNSYLSELKWRKKVDALEMVKENVEEVKKIHSQYWRCFE